MTSEENMGLIEETSELMLDWEKINGISPENHVIPVAVQNMEHTVTRSLKFSKTAA